MRFLKQNHGVGILLVDYVKSYGEFQTKNKRSKKQEAKSERCGLFWSVFAPVWDCFVVTRSTAHGYVLTLGACGWVNAN